MQGQSLAFARIIFFDAVFSNSLSRIIRSTICFAAGKVEFTSSIFACISALMSSLTYSGSGYTEAVIRPFLSYTTISFIGAKYAN